MVEARTPPADHTLPDFLPDAYVVLDAAGIICDANRALSSLIGHARRYAVGKPLLRYIEPSTRAAFTTRLAAVRATGQAQDFVTRLPGLRHGSTRDARVRLGAIRDATGEVVGLHCLMRDITAELAAEARLAQIEAEHQQAMRTRTMELQAIVRMLQAQLAGEAVEPSRHGTALTLVASPSPAAHRDDTVPIELGAHRREHDRVSAPPTG